MERNRNHELIRWAGVVNEVYHAYNSHTRALTLSHITAFLASSRSDATLATPVLGAVILARVAGERPEPMVAGERPVL